MTQTNNIILGIDTSCYTTSIAAITLDKEIIKAVKSSRNLSKFQKKLNEIYGHSDIIEIFGHVNIKL